MHQGRANEGNFFYPLCLSSRSKGSFLALYFCCAFFSFLFFFPFGWGKKGGK